MNLQPVSKLISLAHMLWEAASLGLFNSYKIHQLVSLKLINTFYLVYLICRKLKYKNDSLWF